MADEESEGGDRSPVQSVDRALTILEILARTGEAGLGQIADELGVHKSTVSRMVAALAAHDLVEQPEARGPVRLGAGILRLAGATTARLDLVQEGRPVCRGLAEATGETVNVAVMAGHTALYVDQALGPSTITSYNWVGQQIPLHATSNGRVLVGGELTHDGYDARCLFADGTLLTPPWLYVRRVAGRLADGAEGGQPAGDERQRHRQVTRGAQRLVVPQSRFGRRALPVRRPGRARVHRHAEHRRHSWAGCLQPRGAGGGRRGGGWRGRPRRRRRRCRGR